MPRDVLTPADLLGRIQVLNVACVKCERRGRYRVKTVVREIGLDGNLANWLSGLAADCPRRKPPRFPNRCDVRRADLLKLARGADDDACERAICSESRSDATPYRRLVRTASQHWAGDDARQVALNR
jgi:hypothetical protein